MAVGNVSGLDGAPLVEGGQDSPQVEVVVVEHSDVLVRVVLDVVLRPAAPESALGRSVVHDPQSSLHFRQRRLDAVVVDEMDDLLEGGVAGAMRHVVVVTLDRAFVGPEVLHAQVGEAQVGVLERVPQIGLRVEQDHGGATIAHRVGDDALVGAEARAGNVGEDVLHDVARLENSRVAPAVLRQEMDRLAVRCEQPGVLAEHLTEHLRRIVRNRHDSVR